MKREIKFRCFDKQYKTMHNVNMILFSTNELDHDGNNGEPKSIDHFELMQFTGLHDKNGKEIYEGDILDGQIVVTWRNDLASFALTKHGWAYDHYFGEAVDPGQTEVIGNVYENKNLLNL